MPSDAAIKISISVKGYSGITLAVIGESSSNAGAVWAEPVLIRLPSSIPSLISPTMNEKIAQDVPLVWK